MLKCRFDRAEAALLFCLLQLLADELLQFLAA